MLVKFTYSNWTLTLRMDSKNSLSCRLIKPEHIQTQIIPRWVLVLFAGGGNHQTLTNSVKLESTNFKGGDKLLFTCKEFTSSDIQLFNYMQYICKNKGYAHCDI